MSANIGVAVTWSNLSTGRFAGQHLSLLMHMLTTPKVLLTVRRKSVSYCGHGDLKEKRTRRVRLVGDGSEEDDEILRQLATVIMVMVVVMQLHWLADFILQTSARALVMVMMMMG